MTRVGARLLGLAPNSRAIAPLQFVPILPLSGIHQRSGQPM